MKHLTLFETIEAYNAATLDLPNVSLVEENMSVSYNPWVETRVIAKYNVASTSSPTQLRTSIENNIFKSMEIDGVMLDDLVTQFTFDTIGEHIVKYELYDKTKLGNNAPVFNNSNLVECIIPDNVTNISTYAFTNCSGLTSITIPDSVTSISNYVFNGCSNLTSINVNSGNTVYDSRNNCNAIIETATNTLVHGCKTTIIPDDVTSIGTGAFQNCSGLTSIVIPDSVTSISENAFSGCNGLTSIDIPDNVTSIGNQAFYSCSGLTSIISNATTAPIIQSNTFQYVKTGGTLTVPSGSNGYDTWMGTGNYYLGKYNWTKVEQ